MGEGEGEHPLLDQRRGRIGHARRAPLSRVQDVEAKAQHLAPPAVVGGAVDPHCPAGGRHADLFGERKDALAEAKKRIILSQGDVSFLLVFPDKQQDASPSSRQRGFTEVSLHLGDRAA
jgi:hypothetical protein